MNPSILYVSRAGNLLKALVFAGLAAAAFWLAWVEHSERTGPQQTIGLPGMEFPGPAPRRGGVLAPLHIPFLLLLGSAALFYVGRFGSRAVRGGVAARIEGRMLYFPASYGVASSIPVADVAEMIFDRADRLPDEEAAAAAARFGARLRHGLCLRYHLGGAARSVRFFDNDVDGGTGQLRRFAAHLEASGGPMARPARENDR